jgi:hypothetical protein
MMRSLAAMAVVVGSIAGFADPARAVGGEVFLTWEDCGASGLSDQSNVCLINEGSTPLYAGFRLNEALDDVVGIEVTIDIQHSASTMPDWWRLQGSGECRDGSLHSTGFFSLDERGCVDPWRQLGGGEVLYDLGQPRGQPSQARIVGTWAIRADSARTLAAGILYYGLKFSIDNARTVFPGECAGCAQPACLVLNRINLLRGPGSVPLEVGLAISGPNDAHRATWRGGGTANCSAVPVRARSWGQIKSLYR